MSTARSPMGWLPALGCALALVVVLTGAGGRTAFAAQTIIVLGQNDGFGNCDARGCTTLRAAVREAGTDQNGPDTIVLPAGTYMLDSTLGTLELAQPMTIQSEGADRTFVDGGGAVRVFSVGPAATVVMSGLTVQHGRSVDAFAAGIDNDGSLTLNDVGIAHNVATGRGGGGLSNSGTLTLNRGSVADNEGGGLFSFPAHGPHLGPAIVTGTRISGNMGGGVSTSGALTLSGVTLDHNRGAGGLRVLTTFLAEGTFVGNAMVDSSTITGNQSGGGGGITDGGGTVLVTNSTISGNTVDGAGGAIVDGAGSMTLTNVTIEGNRAAESGGAIFLAHPVLRPPFAEVTLNFVTIAGNAAPEVGGIHFGGVPLFGVFLTIHNSILAGNAGGNCDKDPQPNSAGYNLEDAHDCGLKATGDQSGVDPHLGPLAADGGPTATMALPRNSPAVDAADPHCDVARDQRGVRRPQGPRCDIGAFELQSAAPPPAPGPPVTGRGPAVDPWPALLLIAAASLAVKPRRHA